MQHKVWRKTNLYQERMNKGLTLREVEKQINIGIARLSEYERGIAEPRVSRAIKIAEFYCSTVENLFSDLL